MWSNLLAALLQQQWQAGAECVLPDGGVLRAGAEGIITATPAQPPAEVVVLSCGVHGNETAPVEVVAQLLQQWLAGAFSLRVQLLCLFAHPAALRQGVRYLQQDMNRLFAAEGNVSAPAASPDSQRAQQLQQALSDFFDHVPAGLPRSHFDLHTAIRGSKIEKFAINPFRHGRPVPPISWQRLAAAGISAVLHHPHPSQTLSYFTQQYYGCNSFTLELGSARPFGQNQSLDLSALAATLQAILTQQPLPPATTSLQHFRVSREIIKQHEDFQLYLDDAVENFTVLPQGYRLASQSGWPDVVVEEEQARIVFPNPRVACGLRAGLLVVPQC